MSTPIAYGQFWRNGDGTNTVLGSESVSDIDSKIYNDMTSPLDRLLGKYKRGADVEYNSASAIDITAGEISCQNTAGTVTQMSKNTSSLTLTWADIDTGTEAISTTYYVYGVCSNSATTFTGVISVNSSTPDSGAATYYKLLGSFFNNADGDIVDSSITAPAEEQDVAIETVYDYGTSVSSSTSYTTGVFVAHGTTPSISANSTSTITNLPFSSASSYVCLTTLTGTSTENYLSGCAVSRSSGSSFVCTNSNDEAHTYTWGCIGN